MSSKAMSLKAKIKNYAKNNHIAAQVVLQNYMFERFLERMSKSDYLWGYNIETVMAEKVETILSRGIFSTRPRDFYDIYILGTTQKYDKNLFADALRSTAVHRGSEKVLADTQKIISLLYNSEEQWDMWEKYQKKFAYARDITYQQAVKELERLVK